MENALRERGVEATIVASADSLSGAEPIAHSACYILKLHGDYKDARILNTEAELSEYPAQYDALLDRIFDEYGLIVCGWSGEWDHALRRAFLRAPNRRYPVYWASRSKISPAAEELVKHRGARIVSIMDGDKFFGELRERVETLAQTRRQDPLSVELLVNSVKRYLAKSEHRIQLEDLFAQEVGRLVDRLDNPEFSPQGPWNQAVFRARVSAYELAAEPLARMAGVLGRWGDDGELRIVLDVIGSLLQQADKVGGGLSAYLNLRSYPTVLIFTAYGLGLTRAERWNGLHRLFSAVIDRQNNNPVRIVESLFLIAWKGTQEGAWKQLDGLERRRTPFSDYLLALFSDWGKSFTAIAPDFELMFERFEILGALAYLEAYEIADVRASLAGDPLTAFTWIPIGRVGWHKGDKLLSEIQAGPMHMTFLNSGFAKGDPEFLAIFVANFKRIASHVRLA